MSEEGRNSATHTGHRKRLINRFLSAGSDLYKHEQMELLLFFGIPRKDVNELAHELMDKYETIYNVTHADKQDLMRFEGMGENAAKYLNCIGKMIDIADAERKAPKVIHSQKDIEGFLKDTMGELKQEQFKLFFLDDDDKIIKTETIVGNEADVEVSLKQMTVSVALSTNAKKLVVAHNHPKSTLSPSPEDDDLTMKIALMLHMHGVAFYDHIVVTRYAVYSYRNDGNLLDILAKAKERMKLVQSSDPLSKISEKSTSIDNKGEDRNE